MLELFKFVVVPLVISLLVVPLVKKVGIHLNAYAAMNERTVHTRPIVRIGGVAIYIAFIISMAIFAKVDRSFNAILIGGTIMFIGGLIDDLVDLKPILKLAFQAVAAFILISSGVTLNEIHLPFGIAIPMGPVTTIVSFFWILGITNAINLIDGLDGLCGGFSSILLTVIGSLALVEGRMDVVMISFILLGAIMGCMFYNSYPASIFLGDSGALFIGFNIAAISLLGFKSSTAITLALPLLMLTLPIVDTLSAILRRALKKQSFSHADRGHMHHVLMERFGHRNTVFIMCAMTMLCGLSAYVYIVNKTVGFWVFVFLIIGIELFIEATGMISPSFHPVLGFIGKIKNAIFKLFTKKEKNNN